jgi:hypothetical protein
MEPKYNNEAPCPFQQERQNGSEPQKRALTPQVLPDGSASRDAGNFQASSTLVAPTAIKVPILGTFILDKLGNNC